MMHRIDLSGLQTDFYISPHSAIMQGRFGLLFFPTATFSILRTTRSESPRTLPNTVCLPSNQSHLLQVMKNWQPFVFGPELAIDKSPGPLCEAMKFSSANLVP